MQKRTASFWIVVNYLYFRSSVLPGGQLDCLLKQQPKFYGFKLLKTNKLKLSIFKVS